MLRHFASVAEIVEDVDAAVSFYRDALGLPVERLDEGYALVKIPGMLHFGVWSRASAAQAAFGNPDDAEQIPLGFTIGFEVDAVDAAAERISDGAAQMLHSSKTEPWGQTTARFLTPGGALFEIAETPWARQITQQLEAK